MSLGGAEAVRVKEEPEGGEDIEHEVKDPKCVAGAQAGHIEHVVKEEPGASEGACGVSAAVARAGLYPGHAVKGELMVGPEEQHRPKVVSAHPAPLSTAERSVAVGSACSVMLEHMHVDLQRRTCRIGPHSCKFRLCLDTPQDNHSMMSLEDPAVRVKDEPIGESEAAASGGAYTHHQVKEEQEDEGGHIRGVKEEPTLSIETSEPEAKLPENEASIPGPIEKAEPGVSAAAARAGLYPGHAVKGELVVGPEELHRPKVVLVQPGQTQQEGVGEKPHKCAHCSFSSASKYHFQRHTKRHTSDKTHKCAHCSYSSTSKYHFQRHTKRHTSDKTHKCAHCSYSSTSKYHFQRHTKTHAEAKQYKCEQCSFASTCKKYLQKHKKRHTLDKPYKCARCSYSSTSNDLFQRHTKTHAEDKQYKCEQCSYASIYKAHLELHVMRVHIGERPHKCDYCSYASAQKCDLLQHRRVHTGEKPFSCDICSYATARKLNLTVHARTHTGEKPYKCSYCSYASVRKRDLLGHERTHTSTKPFKCGYCRFASAAESQLLIHEKIHSGVTMYKCDNCDFASTVKSNLESHVKKHESGQKWNSRSKARSRANSTEGAKGET